ncbi:glycosyl hydrolase family 18 protein [Herpetosiphon giganteus]|uniref:glycosyl hydrolase family 18 protein n=1 Tax=Herpetosiphon giganteus TaxID=2029754 RepID=UPI00195ACE39|nr:glycosyl hydrolase family 18 protein [Herpetosiphon giganteus]MBM7845570.1 chitinase [Herpetosiphon giganteus]
MNVIHRRFRFLAFILIPVLVMLMALSQQKVQAAAPAWDGNNHAYAIGNRVSYAGGEYECIQAHTSLPNWNPVDVPALWRAVSPSNPTATPNNPTATPRPATATPRPATATPRPGTATPTPNNPTATPRPATATPVLPTATTTPGGGKRIIGYFAEWGVYGRNYHVRNIKTSGSAAKLTHINYAFGNVVNSRCQLGDTYADYDRAYSAAESVDGVADTWDTGVLRGSFGQLRKLKAEFPHLKVMISLGGWTWSAAFSDAALPANRAAFVKSCVDLFIKDSRWAGVFDGIDIDWEYPGSCGNTCNFRPEDTQNFTALLSEFRSQLNAVRPGLLLTIAAPADPAKIAKIQVGQIHQYLDFINIMTYDLHGAWEANTNFQSNLYSIAGDPGPTYSVDAGVNAWLNGGTPANKVVVGVPFYGRGWQNVPSTNNGLFQPGSAAPATYEAGIEDYKVLKTKGLTRYSNSAAGAAWLYGNGQFWTYDDPAIMKVKTDYVKAKGLGGTMFWELSGDTTDGELINSLYQGR